MPQSDADKWNVIYRDGRETAPEAVTVLSENRHLLPATGTALDAACGRGGNALLLSRLGLETHAWDISQEALKQLRAVASRENLKVRTVCRDLILHPPDADTFDVIVVSHFLDRSIIGALIRALRPNGLVFYQTFIREQRDGYGPSNPDYRLAENELLRLFRGLHLVYYREEGMVGDLKAGFRNEAMLIAQRRSTPAPENDC
jgi:SAM-dependent methyltransferase